MRRDFISSRISCLRDSIIIYIKEILSLNVMLVIGPTLLSGIGQHAKKYTELFPDWKYVQIHEEIPVCERAFVFALPTDFWLHKILELKRKVKYLHCMTVSETEKVHE